MRNDYELRDLNALAALIHARNLRLGFYDEDKVRPFDGMMMNVVGEVAEAQEEWRAGRGFTETYWHPHDVENHGAWDMFLKYRDGVLCVHNYDYDFANGDPSVPEWLPVTPELLRQMPGMVKYCKPEGIPTELADIIIRVLDVCAYHGIDIAAAIADKMAYNDTRPRRHGGKRS